MQSHSSKNHDYKAGENPLHLIIKNCQDIQVLNQFAKDHPLLMLKWAKSINNAGQLPIELIGGPSKLDKKNQEKAKKLLLPYTLARPVNYQETFELLIKKFPAKSGTALYANLELACHCLQQTKETLTFSSTGPNANLLDEAEKLQIENKIERMRALCKLELKAVLKEELNLSNPMHRAQYINIKTEMAIQHGAGNCEEYSFVARYFAKKIDDKKNVALFAMPKKMGDHLFIIFDPFTAHAVLLDPLLGKIFPASLMKLYLQGFKQVVFDLKGKKSQMNCFTVFNPKFHKIELYYMDGPKDSWPKENSLDLTQPSQDKTCRIL